MHKTTMLYPLSDFGKLYSMEKIDFTSFFARDYPSFECFSEVTEKLVSCTGSKFIREETGAVPTIMFGR